MPLLKKESMIYIDGEIWVLGQYREGKFTKIDAETVFMESINPLLQDVRGRSNLYFSIKKNKVDFCSNYPTDSPSNNNRCGYISLKTSLVQFALHHQTAGNESSCQHYPVTMNTDRNRKDCPEIKMNFKQSRVQTLCIEISEYTTNELLDMQSCVNDELEKRNDPNYDPNRISEEDLEFLKLISNK